MFINLKSTFRSDKSLNLKYLSKRPRRIVSVDIMICDTNVDLPIEKLLQTNDMHNHNILPSF